MTNRCPAPITDFDWEDCGVGFTCPHCGQPGIIVAEPTTCPCCGVRYWLEVRVMEERDELDVAEDEGEQIMTEQKCPRCRGCGQIASSDDAEPWSYWAELPPGSDLAVRLGIVYPLPCPTCNGSGVIPTETSPETEESA